MQTSLILRNISRNCIYTGNASVCLIFPEMLIVPIANFLVNLDKRETLGKPLATVSS